MLLNSLFERPVDKNSLFQHFFRTLYNNASKVILINGLPEDANYTFIMSQLLLVGRIAIFKTKGKVYLLNGHIGGKPDEYYYPTRILIANPELGSFDLERDKEAVMCYLTPTDKILDVPKNPYLAGGGLYSLIAMVANVLSECITTVNTTLMNTRVHAIYTADTESAAKSAEPVLKAIYSGKPFSVVTSELLERLNVNPLSEHGLANTLIETLEVCQYVLSLFWNGIGIDANYNMKRERLITAEVDKNVQSLIVPIQTILETLNEGLNKANELFGTSFEAILNPKFEIKSNDVANSQQGDDNNVPHNTSEESVSSISSSNPENDNSSRGISEDRTERSGTISNSESSHSGEDDRTGEKGDDNTNDEKGITINVIVGDNNQIESPDGDEETESGSNDDESEDSDNKSESKESESDSDETERKDDE